MKRVLLAAITMSLFVPSMWVLADTATPATPATFQQKHPRRAQVNKRIHNQNKRINQGVKNGTLTKDQAGQLKANDKAIKSQERADVKANGGYITKDQQKQLNQEEKANSTLIHDEKHPQ